MRLRRAILHSKVGRRLLGLFLLCTVAPTVAIALFSLAHVSSELLKQSEDRLRRGSKASGMAILERLLDLEADLRSAVLPLQADARRGLTHPDARADRLRDRFESLAVVAADGSVRTLIGEAVEAPELQPWQWVHLASGKTLLFTRADATGGAGVWLARALDPGANSSLVVGQASRAYLFEVFRENVLHPLAEFCVLDERSQPIRCSLTDAVVSPAQRALETATSGHFQWSDGEQEQLAGFWSLFLKPNFLHQKWTVVLSERRVDVMAPIAKFRTTYPLLILASILVVSLISIDQIRRRTIPLEKLGAFTRRIAEGHFDADLEVRSGDEFEDLAASFRDMAARLKLQFQKLETLVDVDRAVLSAIEANGVADTVAARIRELYPCDSVAVALVHPDAEDALRVVVSNGPEAGSDELELPGLTPKQKRQLSAQPDGVTFDAERGSLPHYLEPLENAGIRSMLVLPLLVRDEIAGVIAVGQRGPEASDPDQFAYARQLADQAAVALGNIRTIEENRTLAYYDRLTGLPNRLLFRERVDQALGHARRQGQHVAVIILDLDGFKRINDTLGHDFGDQLLRLVAERISRPLPEASLARLGGDEFAILLTDLRSVDEAARLAGHSLETISRPFVVGQQEVFVTASVGIAVFPDDARDPETLIKNADTAMYHAKERGRNDFQFYASSLNETAVERLALESDLRRALERGELRLYYQPVVDVGRREIIGVEALLRWQHAELGLLQPSDFISLAEETGLVLAIGEWALRSACAQNQAWQNAGLPALAVAVNLSGIQLGEEGLLRTVKRALIESGMYPRHLTLELTESVLLDASETTLHTLQGFRDLGVQLSIDDFGTGYSSLVYLKKFPVDVIKIDRSFISDIDDHADGAAIPRAVIAMAHELKLQVVAEGVETEEQLAFLAQHDCDAAQGFLFSEPLPPDAFAKLVREWQS